MIEWLRCSTRILKMLCLNLSIAIHEMTLDKSLRGKLSGITQSYCSNASSFSMLDSRDADTTTCEKKKTIETGYMCILIITTSGPHRQQAYGRLLLLSY